MNGAHTLRPFGDLNREMETLRCAFCQTPAGSLGFKALLLCSSALFACGAFFCALFAANALLGGQRLAVDEHGLHVAHEFSYPWLGRTARRAPHILQRWARWHGRSKSKASAATGESVQPQTQLHKVTHEHSVPIFLIRELRFEAGPHGATKLIATTPTRAVHAEWNLPALEDEWLRYHVVRSVEKRLGELGREIQTMGSPRPFHAEWRQAA